MGIDSAQPDLEPTNSSNQPQPLPGLEVLQLAAATFFDAYHALYSYLNRGECMVDIQDIYTTEHGSGAGLTDSRKEFSVLMITSVGAYLCEQKREMDSGCTQRLRDRAMRSLVTATSKTDLVSFCIQLGFSSYDRSQYRHTWHYFPLFSSASIPIRVLTTFSLSPCRLLSIFSCTGNQLHRRVISNSGMEFGGLSIISTGLLLPQ